MRLRLIATGRVQGIFYRSNTKKHADHLGLTGFVKNLPDGTVEIVAEGSEEKLKELLKWCRHGPMLAHVDDIDVFWERSSGEYEAFSIEY